MSRVSIPKTTPECDQLLSIVLSGLKSNPFEANKKISARVALKRLRKNRCVKAIEYIMHFSSEFPPIDFFAREICDTATEYLNELS